MFTEDVFAQRHNVLGLLPVVPITLGSALLLVIVALRTPASRPADATPARYF
jgi:hypothetical protein